jgi:hypothetical protein
MTEERFKKFINLFEQIFDIKRGTFGYSEGDGENNFIVCIDYCDEYITMTGEGNRFRTPENQIDNVNFDFTGDDVYCEFCDGDGYCLWFIRGDKKDLNREYERFLFLCEEYNEEERH